MRSDCCRDEELIGVSGKVKHTTLKWVSAGTVGHGPKSPKSVHLHLHPIILTSVLTIIELTSMHAHKRTVASGNVGCMAGGEGQMVVRGRTPP